MPRTRRLVVTRDRLIEDGVEFPLPPEEQLGIVVPSSPGWFVRQDIVEFEHVTLTRSQATAGTVAVLDRPDMMDLDVVVAGRALINDRRLEPSDHLVRWPGEVSTQVECRAPVETITASIPVTSIAEFGVAPDSGWNLVTSERALLTMAEALVHETLAHSDQLTRLSAYFVSRLIVELAASVLLVDQGPSDGGLGTPRSSLADRAIHLINLRRTEPGFDPASLAAEIGVSLRTLQRVFAERGTSVAAEIRRQRTGHAVALLQDGSYDVLTVPHIARLAGFTDSAALRRALAAGSYDGPTELRSLRSR